MLFPLLPSRGLRPGGGRGAKWHQAWLPRCPRSPGTASGPCPSLWCVRCTKCSFALTLLRKSSPISSHPTSALCSVWSLDKTKKVSLHLLSARQKSKQKQAKPGLSSSCRGGNWSIKNNFRGHSPTTTPTKIPAQVVWKRCNVYFYYKSVGMINLLSFHWIFKSTEF